jgi:hypothetical protein
MDFLGLIGTIIEFSQKEDEYSDEIKAIRATLTSLELIMKQVDQHDLPEHITKLLENSLADADELMKKISLKTKSWWTTLRNMLPGSDLQKIKEKNQQLVHIINLLNLHLNSRKKFKRSATSNFADEMPNLNGSMPSKKLKTSTFSSTADSYSVRRLSTIQCSPKIDSRLTFSERMSTTSFDSVAAVEDEEEKPNTGEMAFKLKLLCDLSLVQRSSECPDLLRFWNDENGAICTFKRLKFTNLLQNEIQKLSREHAVIKATRKSNDGISAIKECNEQDEMSGPIEEEKQQPEPSTVMSEENSQNSTKMIEEKQNSKYNYEYTLTDLSTNGTYYLKTHNLPENVGPGVELSADFLKLSKNEQVNLEHGDIVGLIMKKPFCKKLVFGFQFLNK